MPVFLDLGSDRSRVGVAQPVSADKNLDFLGDIKSLLGEGVACMTLFSEVDESESRRLLLRKDRLELMLKKPFSETCYVYFFETEMITKNGKEVLPVDLDLFVRQFELIASDYNKGKVTFYSEKCQENDNL